VQKGVPGHTEKGKQDKGDGKKQQQGTTKDEKQGDTANKRDGNGHKIIIQPEGCQLQFKTILLGVCICAIVVLTAYVWRVDSHYKTEVEHLQDKVITMEKMIKSNAEKLTTHDEEIQGIADNMNNAAMKQDISKISSSITELDNKIETRYK
jgi:hypothetical protein